MFFVCYKRTKKCYRCFDLVHHKFYTYADVTFFESVPYFASTASSPIPQHMPSSKDIEKEIVP